MNAQDWRNAYSAAFGSMSAAESTAIDELTAAFNKYGDGDANKMAYIIATVKHETGNMRWMTELGNNCSKYEGRRDLGNTQTGMGCLYKGRGYVQITGFRNYTWATNQFGVDFVNNPELATQPEYAAKITVIGMMTGIFTGKGLSSYISSSSADFRNARRTVNGTDKADLIAGYAQKIIANYSESAISIDKKTGVIVVGLIVLVGVGYLYYTNQLPDLNQSLSEWWSSPSPSLGDNLTAW